MLLLIYVLLVFAICYSLLSSYMLLMFQVFLTFNSMLFIAHYVLLMSAIMLYVSGVAHDCANIAHC